MTLIGHAALGATMYGALRPHATTTRWGLSRKALLLCCLLLPMLPDADAGMHFFVKYGHDFGHRGASHSILFAVVFGLLLAWLLQRFGTAEKTRRVLGQMTLVFSLLMITHGVTDAMTTGGKAPSLLWPIQSEGVWMPERFIPVSPMGSGLVRTKWSQKQLADMERKRARLLRGKNKPFMLVRKVVATSERADHYRRLAVVGIALTELVVLAPLMLLVALFMIYRRVRYGPSVKAPPQVRPPPEVPSEGRPARPWPPAIATGLAVVATLVVGWSVRAPDTEITVSSGQLDDELSTHYRRVAPKQVGPDTPVAVMLHGWRCSHQMMTPMARALARNGVEVWAVDMPGHARSPIPLDTGCKGRESCGIAPNRLFTDAGASILEHLVESGTLAGRDIVVIGHSTGAVAAHDLAVDGPTEAALAGRVVIEGRYRELIHAGNRLIVGKKKYLTEHGDGLELGVLHGKLDDRSGVELFVANRSHINQIHDAGINARVLKWISESTGKPLGNVGEPGNLETGNLETHKRLYIVWIVVVTVLGFVASWLAAVHASRRGWLPPVRPSGHARPGVALTCVIFGSLAATLWAGELFLSGRPWLQGSIGQILPTYLMCASVCVAIPYVALTRRPGRPELRAIAVDVAFALLTFAVIYVTLGLTTDRFLFHVGVSAWRWLRVLTWAAALLPMTLVVHEIGFASDRWWARVSTLLLHAIVWGGVFWLGGVSRNLVGDSMRFMALLMFAETWALAIGWRRRSRLYGALVSALVLAWVLAAAYPILSGAPTG